VIFGKFQNNVLLYSPKNFDILSDWQLVKNYNVGGLSTVSLTGINSNLLSIYTTNGQTFYQSTKNNIWFNRCYNNSSYGVTFIFEALLGTQAFEISNFSSQLNVTFTVEADGLLITFGNNTFTQVTTNIQPIYNITIIKDNSSIYINDNNLNIVLASEANFFAAGIQANPIIRFGYLYEPENVITNGNSSLILGYAQTSVSQFIWHSLQIGFNTSTPSNSLNYNVNTNYVFPNSDSVRVLRSLDGYLYAVSKSIHDQRTTTILSDLSSRIFRFDGRVWSDVTGNFENNLIGISSVYTIVSPNDINSLNGSYFLSGILNKITSKKQAQVSITVGLSTNSVYEEQNINAVILYPYNPNPAGTFLYLNGSSSIVSAPSSIYFGPQDLVKVVQIGLGSTSVATAASLSVTDGTSISTAGFTINPITISGVSLNTSSYVSYSNNVIISTVTLTATPKTARTYQLTSSNSSILAAPNNGIQTVLAGSISSTTTLINGVATASTTQITINAIYRGISTALITDNPFVLTSTLSSGLNSGIFTGNQYYGKVIYTGTLSAAPQGNFPINVVSSAPTILGFPVGVVTVLPNAFSTSITMTIGAAVTASRSISITGVATGTISTASITALQLLITSTTANTYNPVIGLQTSYITYTLNTTPANNVTIVNIVSSPTSINMVYSGLSTVLGGSISTTFGLSTTIQASAIGLAITVQGAPFGFNTSPIPGIILSTEIWRITNLNVSPVTITGGANNSNGIAQSFIITANLNFSTSGLSTSITLSASSGVVGFNTTVLLFNGTATSTGYATGFTTSLVTGVAITAYGPSGYSSTFSGLTVTPFLINSFSVKPVWPYFTSGISTFNLIGGLGATAVGIVTLSAYVATGIQTLSFSSAYSGLFIYNQSATYPLLGIATVYSNSNTAIVNLGAAQTSAYISTSITAKLQSSSLGIGTTTINIDSIPTYSLVFNPFLATSKTIFTLTLSKILPVSTSLGIAISNYNNTYTFNSNQLSGSYQLNIGSFKTDTVFNGFVTYLGSTQQYFISGFANSGGPFGMGYNYAGSLSRFNPNTGSSGSALKYYMGLPNVVKTASGYTHNLALDNLGNVYAIGDNTYGQLGQVNLGSNNTSTFVRINFAYSARDIYAQNNSSYVITADNSLWGFGDNSYYCLGTSVPAAGASTAVPYLISTSVQLFSVFNYRGLVVTFNNQTGIQSVFEFGQYQSAVGLTSKNITQLTYNGSTRNISNLVISSVDVGPQHSVASGTWTDVSLGVSSSGVFAWGFNTSGQIGLATTTTLTTIPNILTKYDSSGSISPIEFSNLIFADSQFSLVVSGSTPNNQGYVSGVSISSSGIGYTSGATVLFSAPPSAANNYTAAGYAVTSGGYITSVSISSSGFGYTSGAVVLFSAPAAGIGTTSATGIAVTNNGQITSVTITNPGMVYTQAPTMTFIGNNGFGTLATGFTSISYAQVTSVVVTAPGFGYTQAPSLTISGTSGFGSGATGFAILSSNATNLNSLYVVGNTNSYNSIGLIVGVTTIATTNYFTPSSPIYKIAKDSQHYIWTLGMGSVYVTGGATDSWPSVTVSVKIPHVLNASNSYDGSAYIIPDVDGVNYKSVLFGFITNYFSVIPKKITQSLNIWALLNNTGVYEGGYEVVINSTNQIDISYVQTVYSIKKLWTNYKNYPAQDISIGGYDGSYFTIGTSYPAKGYLYVLNYSSANNIWTITLLEMQSAYDNTSASYTPGSPTEIASSQFTSSNKPIFVDGSQIYGYAATSWGINQQSSAPPFLLNFVIGFNDGTVALYGFTVATNISIITSWSLGSSVSCLRSLVVYGLRATNRRWLFVATQNGDLYSYDAWGYGEDNGVGQAPFWFTNLSPGQTLPLLASTNIISQNGSQFGYITLIEDYDGKLIIAATSTNYLLVIDIANLKIRAYIKVPAPITSIMWGSNSNVNFLDSGVSNYIYVTTSNGSNAGSNFAYYFRNVNNYEIGLNYANSDGAVQLLTYDGSSTGLGMTNIFHASTNDTMTLVLDSSRPRG
jgi:alpha-tubulin suppressor-like RCC1 family protein